jgi:xanthine dehydrogenase YagS FAD-binding subunit
MKSMTSFMGVSLADWPALPDHTRNARRREALYFRRIPVADDLSIVVARSLTEAITHLSAGGARVAAGGTELAGSLHIDGPRTWKVVDISQLDELKGFDQTPGGGLRIGALSTLADVSGHRTVRSSYAALSRAALSAGRPVAGAKATIGGDICQRPRCWYLRADYRCVRAGGDLCFAADGDNRYHAVLGGGRCHMVHPSEAAPALVALGASARIAGPAGVRVTPFEEFFLPPGLDSTRENTLGPADILTDILFPPSPAGWASTYRRAFEPHAGCALAGVAAATLVIEKAVAEVSVVLGAAAPVPWRSREAEAQMVGREPTPGLVLEAAEAAMADAAPLADNRYKLGLFRDLLVESLEEVCGLRPPA